MSYFKNLQKPKLHSCYGNVHTAFKIYFQFMFNFQIQSV